MDNHFNSSDLFVNGGTDIVYVVVAIAMEITILFYFI